MHRLCRRLQSIPAASLRAGVSVHSEKLSWFYFLSGLINQTGLLKILHMQISLERTRVCGESRMWGCIVTPPRLYSFDSWGEKTWVLSVTHTGLCFQSVTYISLYGGILQPEECGVPPLGIQREAGAYRLRTSAEVCIMQCGEKNPHEDIITSDKRSVLYNKECM